jgi:hypothetical protein
MHPVTYCERILRGLAWFWVAVLAIICAAALPYHRGLPHRPVDSLTNWGQGRTPSDNVCPPDTVRFEVDDIFLECFRTSQPGVN